MSLEQFSENLNILTCVCTVTLICLGLLCLSIAYDVLDQVFKRKRNK